MYLTIWNAGCHSRHVISATLAHLIVSQNGTRLTFCHDFGHLLVSQLKATLEGSPVDVRVRTTKVDSETYFWPDSSSEDYIHRPNALDGMCSYEMAMYYKKVVKSKTAVRASLNVSNDLRTKENDDDDVLASDEEMFQTTSSGNTQILGYTSWFSIHQLIKTEELGCSHDILGWSAIM